MSWIVGLGVVVIMLCYNSSSSEYYTVVFDADWSSYVFWMFVSSFFLLLHPLLFLPLFPLHSSLSLSFFFTFSFLFSPPSIRMALWAPGLRTRHPCPQSESCWASPLQLLPSSPWSTSSASLPPHGGPFKNNLPPILRTKHWEKENSEGQKEKIKEAKQSKKKKKWMNCGLGHELENTPWRSKQAMFSQSNKQRKSK